MPVMRAPFSLRRRLGGIGAFCAGVLAASVAVASPILTPEFSATNVAAGQSVIGTGRGVVVAVVDGGVNVDHPSLHGSVVVSRDFVGDGQTTDTTPGIGHGTGVAAIIAGHDTGHYSGVAPSASLMNVRVADANGNFTDPNLGSGILWAASNGAKVLNLSLGEPSNRPQAAKLNMIIDYASERYGALIVGAVNNNNSSAVLDVPGGAYNALAIGSLQADRYRQVRGNSDYALDGDLRTKPDLVAPGQTINVAAANWQTSSPYSTADGTSFAAPMVSGMIADLASFGRSHRLPTDPLLMRAVLMSSADKVFRYDGSPWAPRNLTQNADGSLQTTQPIDPEQGAGRLNALAAAMLYAEKHSASTPVNAWHEGKLGQQRAYILNLGTLAAGQRVDATTTWQRHITWSDTNHNGVVDYNDTFSAGTALSDFVMSLKLNGVTVATSQDPYDTMQHLSWTLRRGGHYTLEVYRLTGGIRTDQFALAARVLARPTVLYHLPNTADGTPVSGFDLPTVVHGGSGLRSDDGAELIPAIPVPEPSTTVCLIAGSLMLLIRPSRKQLSR